jgi:hypothetical protein
MGGEGEELGDEHSGATSLHQALYNADPLFFHVLPGLASLGRYKLGGREAADDQRGKLDE